MPKSVAIRLVCSLALLLAGCSSTPAGDPTRRAIPVYEEIEVPICERRPEPRNAIRFIPQYEEVVDPVFGEIRQPVLKEVVDPRTGEKRTVRCGTRVVEGQIGVKRRRCFTGYKPEEIPIGCSWKRVETGTRTIRRLKGWRWADDPPWPCEIEAFARKAAEDTEDTEDGNGEEEKAEAAAPAGAGTDGPGTSVDPADPQVEDLPSLEDLPSIEDLPSLDELPGPEDG